MAIGGIFSSIIVAIATNYFVDGRLPVFIRQFVPGAEVVQPQLVLQPQNEKIKNDILAEKIRREEIERQKEQQLLQAQLEEEKKKREESEQNLATQESQIEEERKKRDAVESHLIARSSEQMYSSEEPAFPGRPYQSMRSFLQEPSGVIRRNSGEEPSFRDRTYERRPSYRQVPQGIIGRNPYHDSRGGYDGPRRMRNRTGYDDRGSWRGEYDDYRGSRRPFMERGNSRYERMRGDDFRPHSRERRYYQNNRD